jgi:hypothetical protein
MSSYSYAVHSVRSLTICLSSYHLISIWSYTLEKAQTLGLRGVKTRKMASLVLWMDEPSNGVGYIFRVYSPLAHYISNISPSTYLLRSNERGQKCLRHSNFAYGSTNLDKSSFHRGQGQHLLADEFNE